MTQEIIDMARQAGFVVTHIGDPIGTNYAMIKTFAKLVAAKEREACAELRKTLWCPDERVKTAIENALDFYAERILARKEVGDVNPV